MTPVVFVHGFMGGSDQWTAQKQAFAGANVIALDLPGFGNNAHLQPLPTIGAYAHWVLSELHALGVSGFHLVGHSMGGMVAQEIAARSPDRVAHLVLYGTGAQGVLPGRFESIETSKKRALHEGAQATARRISATWFLEREEARAYEGVARIAERTGIDAILTGLDAMASWNGCAHLPSLHATTLVLWGDQDRTYPWAQTEQLWRSIRNASLAVIPDSAHATHLEREELFNMIVRDFLQS